MEKETERTAHWLKTLDRVIAVLMVAIVATLAWPLSLVLFTSGAPPGSSSRLIIHSGRGDTLVPNREIQAANVFEPNFAVHE